MFILTIPIISLFFFIAVSLITVMYVAPLSVWSFGMTRKRSAILMSLLGLFTTIGELLLGVFVDLLHFGTQNIYKFSLIILSISTILMPYCYTFQYMAPVVCFYSVALGKFIILPTQLILEFYSNNNVRIFLIAILVWLTLSSLMCYSERSISDHNWLCTPTPAEGAQFWELSNIW